jgi:hypothetical protein
VLHGLGVESEVEFAFAGLHQLLRPVLDRLDRLPASQADALRGAFGLLDLHAGRFLIQLGTLGLLTQVAAEQPLLCLVADAQWLDRASADALVFVARRLAAEPIVLLLAANSDDNLRQFEAAGLPELALEGLDAVSAGELLEARVGWLAPQVRERLVEETAGNPLALLELPATLTGEQLAGREPLPERLALTRRLQQVFLERVRRLPAETQTLLLLAATEDTGETATVPAAGRVAGVGPQALEPAERAGLIQLAGQELVFRHPLVRSAIYDDATFVARQAAHRALIRALQGSHQVDRRAWHAAPPPPWAPMSRSPRSSRARLTGRGGVAARPRPRPRPRWSAPRR